MSTYPCIPSILTAIQEHLLQHPCSISSSMEDGRINSAINEDEVLNFLEKSFHCPEHYAIRRPQARDWYDFVVENDTDFFPVNIKVTNTTTADNLNCKLGIYYALTGLKPAFGNEINWHNYFCNLKNAFGKHQDKDYYFLIINKNKPSDVFCTSLRGLQTLTPNGNNLPFQSRWCDNRELCKRTFQDSADFIMNAFGESIKRRSDIYFNFKRNFPQYV